MWESPRFSISLLLAWLSLATVLFDISGNPPFVRLPFDLLIFAYTFRCLDRFFSDRELSAGKLLFLELILVAWVSLAFLLDLLSRHPPEVQKAQVLYVLLHFYLYLKLQLLVWIQPVALGQTPQMEHPEYASGLYVPFAPRITDRKVSRLHLLSMLRLARLIPANRVVLSSTSTAIATESSN